MSTPITSHQEIDASREKLPPVERHAVPEIAPVTVDAPALVASPAAILSTKPAAPTTPPTAREVAIGKWVHKHRHATEGVGGYLGYQIIRNSLAAIPYGIATAATWMGLEKIAVAAEKNNAGSMVAKAARSPIRDVAMIAAGFTLFRGTLKVVRYMKERLFNPHDTEAQTIREVQNFGANLKDTLKEVAPAEVAATPVAAFALGYGRRIWDPVKHMGQEALPTHGVSGLFNKPLPPGMTRWDRVKNVMFTKKGGYLAEAAIVAASFVPFFELGDRRYKDAQVARGIWLNDPSSLVRKSDAQAKEELAAGQELFAEHDQRAEKSAESLKATGHLRPADKPTLACFTFRRVVPTFLGIGAYVAGKRLAYMGMGTMAEHYKPNNWLSSLGKMAVVEGAATSLFWLNASVIDKLEPWYDKHFKDNKPKPLTDPEIRRRYAELKDRLDAKERERKGGKNSIG